jgi:hypothetical protein
MARQRQIAVLRLVGLVTRLATATRFWMHNDNNGVTNNVRRRVYESYYGARAWLRVNIGILLSDIVATCSAIICNLRSY